MEKLKLEERDEVYRIRRLRFANDEPIVVQEVYLSKELCPGIDEYDLENGSIYRHLKEDYHLELSFARESLEARAATKEIAAQLNIKEGMPVLFSTRLVFLSNESPVEFSYSWYRGDMYVFELELK
jgi:GntR family transcriptional regulator